MLAHDKLEKLKSALTDLSGLVIAFSGGVDSTFLAVVAHEVLGKKMLAVTARSEVFPRQKAGNPLRPSNYL
jgi:uncharacterized protein